MDVFFDPGFGDVGADGPDRLASRAARFFFGGHSVADVGVDPGGGAASVGGEFSYGYPAVAGLAAAESFDDGAAGEEAFVGAAEGAVEFLARAAGRQRSQDACFVPAGVWVLALFFVLAHVFPRVCSLFLGRLIGIMCPGWASFSGGFGLFFGGH